MHLGLYGSRIHAKNMLSNFPNAFGWLISGDLTQKKLFVPQEAIRKIK